MIRLFFGGLALLGAFFLAFGVRFLADGFAAHGWPTVEGAVVETVVRSELPQHTSGVTREARDRSRRWVPKITYRWTVEGQTYVGSRWSLGSDHEDFGERAEAVRAARNFPAGHAVLVHYDPNDPSSAVLDPAMNGGTWAPLAIGALFFVFGLLGFVKLPSLLRPAAAAAAPHSEIEVEPLRPD